MRFKFSFHPKELSGLKGLIAERLIRAYLDKVLIPNLKNEFDFVFADMHEGTFSQLTPLSFVESALLLGENVDWDEAWNMISENSFVGNMTYKEYAKKNKAFKKQWKEEHIHHATVTVPRNIFEGFLRRGVFPSLELFEKFIRLIALLENAPDGFILKLNKTGVNLSSYNAIKIFSRWNWEEIFEDLELETSPKETPVVSGEIEIIEIKADRAFIMPHQAESYKKVIAEGYPLRYFHVTFISFEKNEFEIDEKLVKKASELEVILRRHDKGKCDA